MADAVEANTETAELEGGTLVVEATVKTPVVDAAAEAAAAKAALEVGNKEEVKVPVEPAIPVVEYAPTGDPGLDMALDFVGKLGLDDKHPTMVAALQGNFSLLEAHLSALGDKAKGHEKFIALAQKAYKESQAADVAKVTELASAVHNAVGGADNWKAIQAWAGQNATPEEKVEVNAMLTGSKTQARAIAKTLQELYQKASGTVIRPASVIDPNKPKGDVPNATGPLSRKEATRLTMQLASKVGGGNLNKSPEYRAIWARVPLAR